MRASSWREVARKTAVVRHPPLFFFSSSNLFFLDLLVLSMHQRADALKLVCFPRCSRFLCAFVFPFNVFWSRRIEHHNDVTLYHNFQPYLIRLYSSTPQRLHVCVLWRAIERRVDHTSAYTVYCILYSLSISRADIENT